MATKDISDLKVCMAIVARNYLRDHNLTWLDNYPRIDLILETITKQPSKVVWSAMERADRHGLTDWGVSLRGAWLIDKGHELLAAAPAVHDGWGSSYRVGSLVQRAGDDVHMLIDLSDGDIGDFICLVAPADGWIAQGEIERNMTRRYTPLDLTSRVRGTSEIGTILTRLAAVTNGQKP